MEKIKAIELTDFQEKVQKEVGFYLYWCREDCREFYKLTKDNRNYEFFINILKKYKDFKYKGELWEDKIILKELRQCKLVKLTQQRNKLNRQISTLKKATLQ